MLLERNINNETSSFERSLGVSQTHSSTWTTQMSSLCECVSITAEDFK